MATVIVSLAFCALVAVTLFEARRENWDRALQSAENLSRAVAADIGRSIESLGLSLQAVAEDSGVPGVLDLDPRLRDLVLFDRAATASDRGFIALLDRRGDVIASGPSDQTVTGNVSDLGFWKDHRDNPDPGLHVSGAFRSRIHPGLAFALSRRVPDRDGGFGGVAAGTISLDAIRARFETTRLGPHDSIALFHGNGTLMMRVPYQEALIGKNLSDNAVFRKAIEVGNGQFVAISPIDGINKLYVISMVPGSPLHVAVSLSVSDLEAGWRQQVIRVGLATLVLVSLSFAVSYLLRLELRRCRQIEGALRESEASFRLLAENSSDMVSRIGPDNVRRYVSPAASRLVGRTPEELVGRRPQEQVHPADVTAADAAIAPVHRGEAQEATLTYRCRHADGRWIWLETSVRAVYDPVAGRWDGVVVITRDVTERKSVEEKLAHLASSDGLTGIANRRIFDEALHREWQRCARAEVPLSLLLIDIDRFKALNDSQGHQKGDDCLRQVAAALRNMVRHASDLVARYGGEEFVLLLPETDAAGAEAIGERLRAEIEALALPHAAGGPGGVVTVSVGVATIRPAAGNPPARPDDLTEAADHCLYMAKQTGRNRVVHSMLLKPARIGGEAHSAMARHEA